MAFIHYLIKVPNPSHFKETVFVNKSDLSTVPYNVILFNNVKDIVVISSMKSG